MDAWITEQGHGAFGVQSPPFSAGWGSTLIPIMMYMHKCMCMCMCMDMDVSCKIHIRYIHTVHITSMSVHLRMQLGT